MQDNEGQNTKCRTMQDMQSTLTTMRYYLYSIAKKKENEIKDFVWVGTN